MATRTGITYIRKHHFLNAFVAYKSCKPALGIAFKLRTTRRLFSNRPGRPGRPGEQRQNIATPTTIPTESSAATKSLVKPLHQRLGPLTTAFNAYSRSQDRSPLLTQLWSSIAIYLLADISAQTLSTQEKDSGWDFHRTARNLVIGAIASIPGYKWFMFLSRSFNYTSRTRSILTKVVVNQIVFTPIFNTYYFGMSAFLSGSTPDQILQRIKDTVPTSMLNSCFIWPWFQMFNFTFVKAEMRAISSGVFAIGWQAYLSWLNRRAELRRSTLVAERESAALPIGS